MSHAVRATEAPAELEDRGVTLNAVNASAPMSPLVMGACPVCHRAIKRTVPLYGVGVCKSCRNGFASRRQLAYLLDTLILNFGLSALLGALIGLLASASMGGTSSAGVRSSTAMALVIGWLVVPLAFCLKDGVRGRSPGKWLCGVQVVDRTTREPIRFGASFKRNLVTMVPLLPFIIAFTLINGYRWGDTWAHTEVVWVKHRFKLPFSRTGILCQTCGYDLTGNVSGRCPECGTDYDMARRVAVAQPA